MVTHAPADTLTVSLADHRFELRRETAAAPLDLPRIYDRFHGGDAALPLAARYSVTAPEFDLLPAVDPRRIVWQSEHWCLASSPSDDYVMALHASPDERLVTVAQLAPDFSSGRLAPIAGRMGTLSSFCLNYPCDQVIVMNRLLHLSVGVVHAGAVAFDGQGALFCGKSGEGKTTLSRLCRDDGALLLNDERQFIWPVSDGARLAPAPWHGSESEVNPATVPLRAIFHLSQSHANRLTRVQGAEAAARLMNRTIAPFYFPQGVEKLLAIWDELLARIPSYVLEFTPDHAAVAAVREIICG